MTYQPHQSEDVTMKPVAGMTQDTTPSGNALNAIVDAASEALGRGPGEWDMVPAADLARAILDAAEVTRLATHPATAGAPVDAVLVPKKLPLEILDSVTWHVTDTGAENARDERFRARGVVVAIYADLLTALSTPIHKGA